MTQSFPAPLLSLFPVLFRPSLHKYFQNTNALRLDSNMNISLFLNSIHRKNYISCLLFSLSSSSVTCLHFHHHRCRVDWLVRLRNYCYDQACAHEPTSWTVCAWFQIVKRTAGSNHPFFTRAPELSTLADLGSLLVDTAA